MKDEGAERNSTDKKMNAAFIARKTPPHRWRGAPIRPLPSSFILHPSSFQSGGALVMVMIIICVLSVVAANLLLTTTARYHTTFQSASWQESIVAAESGVDLAMNELRKRVVYGPSTAFNAVWSTSTPGGTPYANYGHAFPIGASPYILTTAAVGVEGNTNLQVRVYVDVPGAGDSPTDNFAVAPTSTSADLHLPGGQPHPRRPRRRGPLALVVPHPRAGHRGGQRPAPGQPGKARQPAAASSRSSRTGAPDWP